MILVDLSSCCPKAVLTGKRGLFCAWQRNLFKSEVLETLGMSKTASSSDLLTSLTICPLGVNRTYLIGGVPVWLWQISWKLLPIKISPPTTLSTGSETRTGNKKKTGIKEWKVRSFVFRIKNCLCCRVVAKIHQSITSFVYFSKSTENVRCINFMDSVMNKVAYFKRLFL